MKISVRWGNVNRLLVAVGLIGGIVIATYAIGDMFAPIGHCKVAVIPPFCEFTEKFAFGVAGIFLLGIVAVILAKIIDYLFKIEVNK